MRYLLLINIFFLLWSKFNRISEMNALKEEAGIYYQKKEYQRCISLYEKLLTEYKETDETVKLNLANCYFHLRRYNNAIDNYKLLTGSKVPLLKSNAYLQLGVIYSSNNKKELGLSYFKEALKAMPENDAARYNFELLKKEHDSHKENSTDRKRENSEGDNQTNASESEESRKTDKGGNSNSNPESDNGEFDEEGDTENTGGEEEDELEFNNNGSKETDALTSQRLEEVNMNERQARMILKTMKSNEVQYIQQRRKIISSKAASGRPDW
jgi:tetratricopeptide (TPR) repeat protein